MGIEPEVSQRFQKKPAAMLTGFFLPARRIGLPPARYGVAGAVHITTLSPFQPTPIIWL